MQSCRALRDVYFGVTLGALFAFVATQLFCPFRGGGLKDVRDRQTKNFSTVSHKKGMPSTRCTLCYKYSHQYGHGMGRENILFHHVILFDELTGKELSRLLNCGLLLIALHPVKHILEPTIKFGGRNVRDR